MLGVLIKHDKAAHPIDHQMKIREGADSLIHPHTVCMYLSILIILFQ